MGLFEYRRYEAAPGKLSALHQAWNAFQADEGWIRDRGDTERDGPLASRVHNQFWRETSSSPLQ